MTADDNFIYEIWRDENGFIRTNCPHMEHGQFASKSLAFKLLMHHTDEESANKHSKAFNTLIKTSIDLHGKCSIPAEFIISWIKQKSEEIARYT